MRVVIYARVSTEEQLEGYSIDAQLHECRRWAKDHDHVVAFEYVDEGKSGASLNKRDRMKELLLDAADHKFDIVLIHKLDRMSRNLKDALGVMSILDESNIAMVSLSENFDFSTPIGKMVFRILVGFAEFYLDNLGTEIRKGNVEKASQGRWHGKIAPTGYRYNKETHLMDVFPEEAAMVKRAFELYSTGEFGYNDLAMRLQDEGFHVWHKGVEGTIKPGLLQHVLTNRVYTGDVMLGSDANGKKRKYAQTFRTFEGKHEPLVSRELFAKVAEIRESRFKSGRGVHTRYGHYIFSLVLRCSHCGCPMTCTNQPLGPMYMCSSKRVGVKCDSKIRMIYQADVVEAMSAKLKSIRLPDEWTDAIKLDKFGNNTIDVYSNARHKLLLRRERLTKLYLNVRITDESYWEQDAEIEKALKSLPETTITAKEIAHNAEIVVNMKSVWDKAADDQRKDMLRLIFKTITLDLNTKAITNTEATPSFGMLFSGK